MSHMSWPSLRFSLLICPAQLIMLTPRSHSSLVSCTSLAKAWMCLMKDVMISRARSGVAGPMESITCWVNSGPSVLPFVLAMAVLVAGFEVRLETRSIEQWDEVRSQIQYDFGRRMKWECSVKKTVANSETTIGGNPTDIDAAYTRLQVPTLTPTPTRTPPTHQLRMIPKSHCTARGSPSQGKVPDSRTGYMVGGVLAGARWRVRRRGREAVGALAADIRNASPLPSFRQRGCRRDAKAERIMTVVRIIVLFVDSIPSWTDVRETIVTGAVHYDGGAATRECVRSPNGVVLEWLGLRMF